MPSPLPHDWTAAPCLDLINSRWSNHLGTGELYDRLPLPRFRRAFLKRWKYRVGDPDDARAQSRLGSLRILLRDVLERYAPERPIGPRLQRQLESAINRPTMTLRMKRGPDGYSLTVARSGDEWDVVISDIAASAARLMAEHASVKVCANPACSWMFTDESKPRNRRWCNVAVCGSLVNVRRHRAARHD